MKYPVNPIGQALCDLKIPYSFEGRNSTPNMGVVSSILEAQARIGQMMISLTAGHHHESAVDAKGRHEPSTLGALLEQITQDVWRIWPANQQKYALSLSRHPVSNLSPEEDEQFRRVSPEAIEIAGLLVKRSKAGETRTDYMSADAIRRETQMPDECIARAVQELLHERWVTRLGQRPLGFHYIAAANKAFAMCDPMLGIGFPLEDARKIGQMLLEKPSQSATVRELADELGWSPRRLNPAMSSLGSRGLVSPSETYNTWMDARVHAKPGLNEFLEG